MAMPWHLAKEEVGQTACRQVTLGMLADGPNKKRALAILPSWVYYMSAALTQKVQYYLSINVQNSFVMHTTHVSAIRTCSTGCCQAKVCCEVKITFLDEVASSTMQLPLTS